MTKYQRYQGPPAAKPKEEDEVPIVHVFLPTLQTGSDVTLVGLEVAEGEVAKKGEPLATLECRKATYPYKAPATGVVSWSMALGASGPPGAKLAEIETP